MTVNELIEELNKYSNKFGDCDIKCGSSITNVMFGDFNDIILITEHEQFGLNDIIDNIKDAIDDIKNSINMINYACDDLEDFT